MRKIIFTDLEQSIPGLESPQPASEVIPDWYKRMASYFGKEYGLKTDKEVYLTNTYHVPQTMKRCMPLFDAMTAGYIVKTICDVQITQENGAPFYIWSANYEVITFHGRKQTEGNPVANPNIDPPKWTSPWTIQTPPGYSSMIVPPMNHHNGIFEIFSGVVDTDTYNDRVHFPFRLLDWGWEGVIPAGTPLAQIIPFKRDSFQMEMGGEEQRKRANLTNSKIRQHFYNAYRNHFWSRKSFR